MIPDIGPYSSYKDSGLPWLGKLPRHWTLRRTKTLLHERSAKGFPDEPLLAATQTKGVVRKEKYEARTVLALKDLHLLKLVRVGDFVVSLRSFQGGLEYAHDQGIISPAYTVLHPRDGRSHAYLARVFKSKPYIDNLRLFVTGIRQGQNIDYAKLARSPLPYPPLTEQAAIVRFIDHVDRRISRYIRAKEKLIELLDEQKQAIIHQAVTGQIDVRTGQPYAAYRAYKAKISGAIPLHWQECRLRNVVSIVTTGSRGWSSYASDDGPLFIRVANLSRGSLALRFADVVRLDLPITTEAERTRIVAGDILLSVTAYIGSVGIAHKELGEAYVSQHVARCRPVPGSCAKWLGYVLLSEIGQTHGKLSQYGGTKDGLSLDDVKNYPILLPPYEEQQAAVRWIEDQSKSIVNLHEATRREIALVREYGARLIADVVTGKVDVREAAAQLPDADPLETDDTLEDTPSTDQPANLDEPGIQRNELRS